MKRTIHTVGLATIASACATRVDLGEIEDDATSTSSPIAYAAVSGGMCALDESGVACWTAGRPHTVRRVPELGSPVRLAGAGSQGFLCAIDALGELACGDTRLGALGKVPGAERFTEVSVGFFGGCALSEAKKVLCWGSNGLQVNVTVDAGPERMELVPLPGPAVSVSVSDYHACAVLEDGRVFCHGMSDYGRVSGVLDASGWIGSPVQLPGIEDAKQVALGMGSTCVLHRSGKVTCIGEPSAAGLGPSDERAVRGELPGLDGVVSIASERSSACALTAAGGVHCWGRHQCGTFQDRSGPCQFETAFLPTLVPGFESVKNFGVDSGQVCTTDLEDRTWCRGFVWDDDLGMAVARSGPYRIPL